MGFSAVLQLVQQSNCAGFRYEKEGHAQFRDCVLVCRNGKLIFQRFCYGEAAGRVCEVTATLIPGQGEIPWDFGQSDYSKKTEAPQALTGQEGEALLFDGKTTPWRLTEKIDYLPQVGLGRVGMLLSKLRPFSG